MEVAAFILGAVTATVGIVAFAGPHLRAQRDEHAATRADLQACADALAHATQGRSLWGPHAGVTVVEKAEQERRDTKEAFYPDADVYVGPDDPARTGIDGFLDDGTPIIRGFKAEG